MFLLYGPNGIVKSQGANATNYDNPEYNKLFEKMESMDSTPERLKIIKRMADISNDDAAWFGPFHNVGFALYHGWNLNTMPAAFTASGTAR